MARFHVAILFLAAIVGSIQCCDHETQAVTELEGEKAASDVECGFSCCGKPDGNYPNGDSQHYWQCICGRAYYKTCPPCTKFSNCARRCVPCEDKAECAEKQKASLKLKDILKA